MYVVKNKTLNNIDLPKFKDEKKNVKKNKKKHKHGKIYTFFVCLLLIIIILFFVFIAYCCYYIYSNAPEFDKLNLVYQESSIILDKDGEEIARIGNENRELVDYDDLPEVLIDAIVSAEDARFFQHKGVDLYRFVEASYHQLKGYEDAGGASTITMQISKNAFTSNVSVGLEGVIRKFTDIYMSVFQLEKNYSKEELLEIYVNFPYLGSGSYGVEAASQVYFGKHVNDLTLSEAALIAGLFNAPSEYDPYEHLYNATARRDEVLNLMYKHGYITYEQLQDELSVSVSSLLIGKDNEINGYQGFIDTVIEEVIDETGLNPYETPMIINTTMDKKVQDAVNKVMSNSNNFKDSTIQAGLAVTSTSDGSILGIGASRYRTGLRQFNYATMINRQPGSSIKPFMDYGPLFEYTDSTPSTYILDEPYKYTNGTTIYNANRDYKGNITILQALAESRNIPALKVFQSLDKTLISNYVHSFGIDYGTNLYESAAIGAFEGVSPLTMSAAYGAYARGGYYIEPYSYTSITYRDTGEVYNHPVNKVKVCSAKTAYYINQILTTAVKDYTILGTLDVGNTQVAGKTGTTTLDGNIIKKLGLNDSAIMDSWGCVYTREYSVALWYGYNEVSKKYYMVPVDGTLGRRRIIKKLSKMLFTTDSQLVTSDADYFENYE